MNTNKTPNDPLPTTLQTDRLTLRCADVSTDADCAKINYICTNVSGTTNNLSAHIKPGPEAAAEICHKNRVQGAKQEFCTRASKPANIFWLFYARPSNPKSDDGDSLENLAGFLKMSFRDGIPCPGMGYITVAAHAGRGYASEAGKAMLHYWRDLVGVREIAVICPVVNERSCKCAERMGFVRGGELEYEIGGEGEVERRSAVAYMLPGIRWEEGVVMPIGDVWSKDKLEPATMSK